METAVVVYIRGNGVSDYLWYRMEFENNTIRGGNGKKEEKRIKFKRVGQLFRNEGGYGGGWDIIGEEDIYWVGGFRDYGGEEYSDYYACLDVFKHNCSNPKPDSWVKVSPRKIPRQSPFVAAVSGGKKLCLVSGYEHHLPKPNPNPNDDDDTTIRTMDRWNAYSISKAGELYDPNTDSWTYLEAPVEPFRDYNSITAALALDKDQILFHSRASGTALYYNLDTKVYISDLDFFEYFPITEPPEPLQGCKNLDILHMVCQNSRPVLCFDTFYWFTYDLHLFAYDIELETWYRSPSLADILYPLKPPTFPILVYPPISILLGLPTGELLVIVQEDDVAPDDARYLSLASLSVAREGQNSLKVSLLFFQPFSVDDPSFLLHDGKAIL